MEPRIFIITGHYGSGKTEVAINYALSRARQNKVALIDLDIVNPYFRSREVKDLLEEQGIRVVTPAGEAMYADIPALSPVILGMIQDSSYYTIIDVGGDDMGAKALGRFQKQLAAQGYEMAMVVNPFRPNTKDVASTAEMVAAIEKSSRLAINSLIANPHLCEETNPDIVKKGYHIVQQMTKDLNLTLKFVSIKESLSNEFQKDISGIQVLPMKLFMLPPWHERGFIDTDPRSKLK